MKISNSGKVKAGFLTIILCGVVSGIVIISNIPKQVYTPETGEPETWHMIARIDSWALGEYDPGDEGWLCSFHLDGAQNPNTTLNNNATDWSTDANARGYVDTDGANTDLKSEDPAYIVVRCKFDADAKEGDSWNWSRYRVNLTVSGDETITDIGEYDNSTTAGDAVVSGTNSTHIYINFFWDDGSDLYRVTDDGTLTWSISIYEKY